MAVIAAGGGDYGVWGIAPSARVMAVTVADQSGDAKPSDLARGIRWAIGHHATVINISLASLVADTDVTRAVDEAIASGIPVVAAAGDFGDAGPEFPASLAGVVAVYGQDQSGRSGVHSNLPNGSGVVAPGEEIVSLVPLDGALQKRTLNGTSPAAAIVSGIIAACLSAARGAASAVKRCISLLAVRAPRRFVDLGDILRQVVTS